MVRGTPVRLIDMTEDKITFQDCRIKNIHYIADITEKLRPHVSSMTVGMAHVNIEYDYACISKDLEVVEIDGVPTALVKIHCRLTYSGCFGFSNSEDTLNHLLEALGM